MEPLLVLVLAVGAWYAWRTHRAHAHGPKTASTREDQVLSEIEALMWKHWREAHEGATPESIARLVRDDLQNARAKDPLAYKWATAETAGRVFRNFERELRAIATEMARERAAPALPVDTGAVAEQDEGVEVVRLKECRACGTRNRGDAYKCSKCGELFPKKARRAPTDDEIAKNKCASCGTHHPATKVRCRKCGAWLPASRE